MKVLAPATATGRFGLGRSAWGQGQTVLPVLVVGSLLPSADSPKSEISTVPRHQHSSPMSLFYVLVRGGDLRISCWGSFVIMASLPTC